MLHCWLLIFLLKIERVILLEFVKGIWQGSALRPEKKQKIRAIVE